MRALRVALILVVALALQTTLARFLVRGAVAVDLVLVAVIFLGLTSGPNVGVAAGTIGGLVQDALGTGIVGIGGLAKTLVGFLVGRVGTAFIVAQPVPRFLVFFAATILELVARTLLRLVLDPGPPLASGAWAIAQAVGNALVGVVMLQLSEGVPRALDRRRVWRRPRKV